MRSHFSAAALAGAGLIALLLAATGCNKPAVRSQSPDEATQLEEREAELVGDVALPVGLEPIVLEGVSLVTGLPGTGSDSPPSAYRSELMKEMQRRGIDEPNKILQSKETALVLVRGYLRPGVAKGDTFDIEVRCVSDSETVSLRGGWLMETRLRQFAVLGGSLREGKVLALAGGAIMIDPDAEIRGDKINATRGRVLGGGVSLESRPLGLRLKPGSQSVVVSSRVSNAIQKRFHSYAETGLQKGAATAKTDEFIELDVHPRYKHNIPRYLQVVRMIPLQETAEKRGVRMASLEQKLLDPISSARAALQLEAVGNEGAPLLRKGLTHESPEVQFYAAEALAYLGDKSSVDPLATLTEAQPAFRVFSLTALATVDDVRAYERLRGLIDCPSAETRYGAFRALWVMDKQDPFVRGELLNGRFHYHVLDSVGPPMVHATRSFQPEIVVFGREQRFRSPLLLKAGPRITVVSRGGDRITVARLATGEPAEERETSLRVDDVLRAVAELGGSYPDVVQLLQEAKSQKVMEGRFEIDALPEAGRTFERAAPSEGWDDQVAAANPGADEFDEDEDEETPKKKPGFFGRMNPFKKSEKTEASDE
ncbi:MAG TPA: flagellar basal body P-ring protein FlgI [Pirellulales bacterium]